MTSSNSVPSTNAFNFPRSWPLGSLPPDAWSRSRRCSCNLIARAWSLCIPSLCWPQAHILSPIVATWSAWIQTLRYSPTAFWRSPAVFTVFQLSSTLPAPYREPHCDHCVETGVISQSRRDTVTRQVLQKNSRPVPMMGGMQVLWLELSLYLYCKAYRGKTVPCIRSGCL